LGTKHVPEKWKPVFRKNMRQQKNLEHIPIQLNQDML
jgi:hypothetical protein